MCKSWNCPAWLKEILLLMIFGLILSWSMNGLIKNFLNTDTNQKQSQRRPLNAAVAVGITGSLISDYKPIKNSPLNIPDSRYCIIFFFMLIWISGVLFSKFLYAIANRLCAHIDK